MMPTNAKTRPAAPKSLFTSLEPRWQLSRKAVIMSL